MDPVLRLNLRPGACISCGICEDLCPRGAIAMHRHRGCTPEGPVRLLSEEVIASGGASTFPFLSRPDRCDDCGRCEAQCPTAALVLVKVTTCPAVR